MATSVAIADVNKDGRADLIVTNQCMDGSCTSGGVSVLLGKANGTFHQAQSYATGGLTAVSVAVGSFNGDKKIDLVVANQCQSNGNCNGSLGVLMGNGNGTFQAPLSIGPSNQWRGIAVGDFNEDGKPDLAAVSYGEPPGLSILFG